MRNVITQTMHGLMIVNRYDSVIGACLLEHGAWEPVEIDLLQKVLTNAYPGRKGMTIVDIGANIGTHSIPFSRFPFEDLTVIAFEPQRLLYYMLAGNIALNCCDNIFAYGEIVSDISGESLPVPILNYSRPGNFGALELQPCRSPEFSGEKTHRTEQVVQLRLDHLDLKDVGLIKIDVEGMEDKVINGAKKTIESNRPILLIEHHKTDFESIKTYLFGLGYLLFSINVHNVLAIPVEIDININGAEQIKAAV